MKLLKTSLRTFGVLSLLFVCAANSTDVSAATPPDSCFSFSGGTISNYYDFEGNNPANPACPRDVDIPATIGGVPVTTTTQYSMSSKGLTALTIPSSLTNMAGYSFSYNQITELVVPEGVTTLNTGVFRQNLLTQVTLPSTLTSIGDRAFVDNDLLSVDIPAGVTYIGPRAFWGNALTTITIPSSVQTIASEAFFYNYGLSTVIFEGTVTTFGSSIFLQWVVETIEYNGTVHNINDSGPIPEQCFNATGGTINSFNFFSMTVMRDYGNPCIQRSFIIPDTINGNPVTAINNNVFSNRNLVSVAIPSTVTSIGSSAFSNNSLTSITIPPSITSIGDYAFQSNDIMSITLPSTLTSLGAGAFGFNDLSTVDIPDSITVIGDSVFAYNNLTTMSLGPNVTTIGNSAFSSNDLTSVSLPSTVTSIGNYAFNNNKLTSITIPNAVTAIGTRAFSSNLLTSLSVPASVATIGSSAFSANQLASVTLANGLTSIGSSAFSLNQLSAVTIPNSVTTISPNSFALQSQWGRDLDYCQNGAPCMWSSDPAVVQDVYDSIWYVRLYSQDPSNPNNLKNGTLSEEWWTGSDGNANGVDDPLGGHIINPASIMLSYVNQADTSLRTTQTFTGEQTANDYLNNYFVTQGPVVPMAADPQNPTPQEQQAIDDAFTVYYRIGDEVTITPPTIEGYSTPPAQTFLLAAGTNSFNYVYTQPSDGGGELAQTGMNSNAILGVSLVSMLFGVVGLALFYLKKRRGDEDTICNSCSYRHRIHWICPSGTCRHATR